ncbi:MAG: redox-regulated ATPase YchF, partial [Nanoarchaeota archaeon]
MQIGLIGKSNTGKSTFFKASTLANVEIANRPFVTIKPSTGTAYVAVECADKEFNVQCNPRFGYCINHLRFVPFDLIDVAGLIPGSHEGKGLGLEFLNDLNQADVLIHVIDCPGSTNEKGEPVNPGTHDPAKDILFIEYELDMWFFNIIKKGWEKFVRTIQQEKQDLVKALTKQLSGLKVPEVIIKESIKEFHINPLTWEDKDLFKLASKLRRKTKPMIIAANKIDIPESASNLERLKREFPNYLIIPCSGDSELALREASKSNLIEYIPGSSDFKILKDLSEQQRKALNYIKENVLNKYNSTGVQEILNKAVFDLLKCIAVFPGGVNKLSDSEGRILPDCYIMPPNSTALDFAFKLHTDLGNNFIRAIN